MKKILAIANSFGVDAGRYLYGIARAQKEEVKLVVLHIGGCSLHRHYRNLLSEERAYEYHINGMYSGLKVSLKEAILSDEWDYVITQQCSPKSGEYETYQPYLDELAAYVRKCVPAAKLYLQMTWSFADGCSRFELTPFKNREEMIPAVREAYSRAAEAIRADGMIPSLDAMCRLYDEIGERTYRDGFHCSLGTGRYLLGCVWFMTFFGKDVAGNAFRDFDVEVSEEDVLLAQRIAREVV